MRLNKKQFKTWDMSQFLIYNEQTQNDSDTFLSISKVTLIHIIYKRVSCTSVLVIRRNKLHEYFSLQTPL